MKAQPRLTLCSPSLHSHASPEPAATNKITVSPALAEAVANGEAELPAFTAAPVESQYSGSASSSWTPSTITPVISGVVTPTPKATNEVAVDTFKSNDSLSNTSSSGSNGILIAVAVVGCVGAAAMAVVYKRRSKTHENDDDDDDRSRQQQNPQPSQSRATFESANYTPGRPSLDGMLQDDRMTTGSSAMMPVFSVADGMDMSGGIVRLSSPFGGKHARISSPAAARGAGRSTDNIEFSAGCSPRGTRSTAASSSSHSTVVHIQSEMAL